MPRQTHPTTQLLRLIVLSFFICVPLYGQKSGEAGEPKTLLFSNLTSVAAEIYWIDFEGREQLKGKLAPGAKQNHESFVNHAWRVKFLGRNRFEYTVQNSSTPRLIADLKLSSPVMAPSANVTFVTSENSVEVYRVNSEGREELKTALGPGRPFTSPTMVGDIWIFKRPNEKDAFDWYAVKEQPAQSFRVVANPHAQDNFQEDFYGGRSSLGRGFDMFAATKSRETRVPLVLFEPQSTARQIYGQTIEVPANVNHNPFPDSEFRSDLTASYNALEVQNSLQTSLGIEGGYRGIKASVEATYGTDSVKKAGTSFVEYKVQIKPATFSFRPESPIVLAPAFQQDLERFRDANVAADQNVQDQFFRIYGTHYVHQVSLGAACTMVARLSHSANMDKEDIGVAVKASFDGKVFSAGVSNSTQVETLRNRFERNSEITFTAAGGDANIIVTGGQGGNINSRAFNKWVNSTKAAGKLSDVERHLKPIWELSQDPVIRTNLRKALDTYAARRSTGDLDSTAFTKKVMSYEVTLTLERIQVNDDNDSGVDAGDLFWLLWLERPDEFDASRISRVTLSEVLRDGSIGISSGETRFFRDLVTDRNALTQVFKVPVGGQFKIGGRAGDADGGLLGGDDIFGESEQFIRAPTERDPKRASKLLPHEQSLRFNAIGDVIVFFRVTYRPIL